MITEERALEIAKEVGIPEPKEMDKRAFGLFFRALMLAVAQELEAVATWSADGIRRYIQQLTDDQFCQKCVRGQCTGDKDGVCCGGAGV